MKHELPAGLHDHNGEIYATPGLEPSCLMGRQVLQFHEFPADLIDKLEANMQAHPERAHRITLMGITGRLPMIGQWAVCRFGGFDNVPDIVDGQLQAAEYWACPKRGVCPHEGLLCEGLKTATGETLTPREIDVLKLIALGYQDKQIAGELGIARNTVLKHNLNLRIKTALPSKPALTRFATQKQLI